MRAAHFAALQVLVYCLDAIPVFLCCAAFIAFPPGRCLGTISSSVADEAAWGGQIGRGAWRGRV